jgi:hypothetical protein
MLLNEAWTPTATNSASFGHYTCHALLRSPCWQSSSGLGSYQVHLRPPTPDHGHKNSQKSLPWYIYWMKSPYRGLLRMCAASLAAFCCSRDSTACSPMAKIRDLPPCACACVDRESVYKRPGICAKETCSGERDLLVCTARVRERGRQARPTNHHQERPHTRPHST